MSGFFRSWGPVAVWLGAIFVASSRAVPQPISMIPDWIGHGGIYAIASFLTCRALAGGIGNPLRVPNLLLAIISMTLFGASDEWHQSFVPGREASPGDVAKDLAGALLGAWVFSRCRLSDRT